MKINFIFAFLAIMSRVESIVLSRTNSRRFAGTSMHYKGKRKFSFSYNITSNPSRYRKNLSPKVSVLRVKGNEIPTANRPKVYRGTKMYTHNSNIYNSVGASGFLTERKAGTYDMAQMLNLTNNLKARGKPYKGAKGILYVTSQLHPYTIVNEGDSNGQLNKMDNRRKRIGSSQRNNTVQGRRLEAAQRILYTTAQPYSYGTQNGVNSDETDSSGNGISTSQRNSSALDRFEEAPETTAAHLNPSSILNNEELTETKSNGSRHGENSSQRNVTTQEMLYEAAQRILLAATQRDPSRVLNEVDKNKDKSDSLRNGVASSQTNVTAQGRLYEAAQRVLNAASQIYPNRALNGAQANLSETKLDGSSETKPEGSGNGTDTSQRYRKAQEKLYEAAQGILQSAAQPYPNRVLHELNSTEINPKILRNGIGSSQTNTMAQEELYEAAHKILQAASKLYPNRALNEVGEGSRNGVGSNQGNMTDQEKLNEAAKIVLQTADQLYPKRALNELDSSESKPEGSINGIGSTQRTTTAQERLEEAAQKILQAAAQLSPNRVLDEVDSSESKPDGSRNGKDSSQRNAAAQNLLHGAAQGALYAAGQPYQTKVINEKDSTETKHDGPRNEVGLSQKNKTAQERLFEAAQRILNEAAKSYPYRAGPTESSTKSMTSKRPSSCTDCNSVANITSTNMPKFSKHDSDRLRKYREYALSIQNFRATPPKFVPNPMPMPGNSTAAAATVSVTGMPFWYRNLNASILNVLQRVRHLQKNSPSKSISQGIPNCKMQSCLYSPGASTAAVLSVSVSSAEGLESQKQIRNSPIDKPHKDNKKHTAHAKKMSRKYHSTKQVLTGKFKKFLHDLKSHLNSVSNEDIFKSFINVMYGDINKKPKKKETKHNAYRRARRRKISKSKKDNKSKKPSSLRAIHSTSICPEISSKNMTHSSVRNLVSTISTNIRSASENLDLGPQSMNSNRHEVDVNSATHSPNSNNSTIQISPSFSSSTDHVLSTPPLQKLVAESDVLDAEKAKLLSTSLVLPFSPSYSLNSYNKNNSLTTLGDGNKSVNLTRPYLHSEASTSIESMLINVVANRDVPITFASHETSMKRIQEKEQRTTLPSIMMFSTVVSQTSTSSITNVTRTNISAVVSDDNDINAFIPMKEDLISDLMEAYAIEINDKLKNITGDFPVIDFSISTPLLESETTDSKALNQPNHAKARFVKPYKTLLLPSSTTVPSLSSGSHKTVTSTSPLPSNFASYKALSVTEALVFSTSSLSIRYDSEIPDSQRRKINYDDNVKLQDNGGEYVVLENETRQLSIDERVWKENSKRNSTEVLNNGLGNQTASNEVDTLNNEPSNTATQNVFASPTTDVTTANSNKKNFTSEGSDDGNSTPDSNNKTNISPTDFEGKNFVVTLELLNETFDKSLKSVRSRRFQKLREEIQNEILQLYQDDETYVKTELREFQKASRQDSVLARLVMSFSSVNSSHLSALHDKLKDGKLGNLDVSSQIINITRLNDDSPDIKWCSPPCFTPYRCFPSCSADCCTMQTEKARKFQRQNQLLLPNYLPNPGTFYLNPQLYRNTYSYPVPCWPGCSSVCYPQCSFACCLNYQALKRP